jgi:hypothetical protein
MGYVWLATFLLFPVAGWPLLSHPGFRRFPFASRLVLAGGVGAVLMSFLMTASALLGARWHVGLLIGAAMLIAAGLRAALPSAASDPAVSKEPVAAVGAAGHALSLVAVLTALLATASGAASSPDLVFFWGVKAQHYAAARTVDVAFLQDPFHLFMHAYYPPLVTNLFALASIVAGRFVWTAALLTFPLLLAAIAAGLSGILRAWLAQPAAAAFSALVVSALGYLGMEADIAGNGEMPLLFFETMAMALLLSPHGTERSTQLLAGLLLAGAAVTKVEGLPFVVAAAVLFVLRRHEGAWSAAKRLLLLLSPTAVALIAWFAFGATRRLFLGYGGGGRFLDLHVDHVWTVVKAIGHALSSTGQGLPWLVPLAVLAAAGRLRPPALLPLGVAAALTGFLLFTYIHRSEDPTLWISWSAARVFSPVAMLLGLAATCRRDGEGEDLRTERASRA